MEYWLLIGQKCKSRWLVIFMIPSLCYYIEIFGENSGHQPGAQCPIRRGYFPGCWSLPVLPVLLWWSDNNTLPVTHIANWLQWIGLISTTTAVTYPHTNQSWYIYTQSRSVTYSSLEDLTFLWLFYVWRRHDYLSDPDQYNILSQFLQFWSNKTKFVFTTKLYHKKKL